MKEDKIEELKRLVGETKYYRNQIGLPNLPEDFQQNTDELSWQKAQHERSQSYTHNVDSGNIIFTRYLEAFCEQCFGENEHDVCVGSYTDPQEPGKTAYDCEKHMLLIPDNMRDAYPLDECAKYYLHEVAGHGTDPEIVVNQFQPDVYIRILHGKARMLTKIFDFPDLFFNHKDDTTLVDIFGFVQIYLDARFKDFFGQKRLELIENDAELTRFLSLVCEADGAGSVRPAKNFDREKMGELVQLIARGEIRLKGELSSLYLKVFSSYLHEHYAELIKHAVLYPDLINHDPDILEGATEIFSAIKGETVSLESLRREILGIPAKL